MVGHFNTFCKWTFQIITSVLCTHVKVDRKCVTLAVCYSSPWKWEKNKCLFILDWKLTLFLLYIRFLISTRHARDIAPQQLHEWERSSVTPECGATLSCRNVRSHVKPLSLFELRALCLGSYPSAISDLGRISWPSCLLLFFFILSGTHAASHAFFSSSSAVPEAHLPQPLHHPRLVFSPDFVQPFLRFKMFVGRLVGRNFTNVSSDVSGQRHFSVLLKKVRNP